MENRYMLENAEIENYQKQLKKYIEKEKIFNIFRVLKLENYEIRHSNFLAWLLDPNETHKMGGIFFQDFIKLVNQKTNKNLCYKNSDEIIVKREADYIDILILNKAQKYLVLIENKIQSKQHSDQLEKYYNVIKEKFDDKWKCIYIYLKPFKNEKINSHYIFITYDKIINIIKKNLNNVNDIKVKIFLENYVAILNDYYLNIDEYSILEICLKLQENQIKLTKNEDELVLKMAEKRRYEIMLALKEVLEENIHYSDIEHKIYKIDCIFDNKTSCTFDNTNTKNNSQINVIYHNETKTKKLFLDETQYNKIFYTYSEKSFDEIKNKLKNKLKLI